MYCVFFFSSDFRFFCSIVLFFVCFLEKEYLLLFIKNTLYQSWKGIKNRRSLLHVKISTFCHLHFNFIFIFFCFFVFLFSDVIKANKEEKTIPVFFLNTEIFNFPFFVILDFYFVLKNTEKGSWLKIL